MPNFADIPAAARRGGEVLRQSGPRLLARKVVAELFYRRLVVFEAHLGAPRPPARCDLPLRFDVLSADRVQEYLDCLPDADLQQLRMRMSNGDRCRIARLDGRVVAVQWAAFRDVQVTGLGLMLSLTKADAYLYGLYTAPAWRRRGVGVALRAHTLDWLQSEGFRRALSAWIPENAEARSLNPSRGQPFAVVSVIRLGPWRRQLRPRPRATAGRFYSLPTSATRRRGSAGSW